LILNESKSTSSNPIKKLNWIKTQKTTRNNEEKIYSFVLLFLKNSLTMNTIANAINFIKN